MEVESSMNLLSYQGWRKRLENWVRQAQAGRRYSLAEPRWSPAPSTRIPASTTHEARARTGYLEHIEGAAKVVEVV